MIIEFKICKAGDDKIRILKAALTQIEKKNYVKPYFKDETVTYGMGFSGKKCFIEIKKLK